MFFDVFYLVLKLIISFLVIIVFSLAFSLTFNFIKCRKRFGKISRRKFSKEPGFLKKLIVLFPRQYFLDKFARDPDYFPLDGVHMICGRQGSGKTIFLTWWLRQLQRRFSSVKVSSNYFYEYQDSEIRHWRDIVFNNNGIYGKIDVLDEIQNWFNSLQSKDFPIDMMTEITQGRKQRKMIIGTSQVFGRVAKPIREQVYRLYEPHTFFGCVTFVHVTEPLLDENALDKKRKHVKWIWFVHDKELRESFDTFRKVLKMSAEGYYINPQINHSGFDSSAFAGAVKSLSEGDRKR